VHRWHKDVALIILLPGRMRPVVTRDDADLVTAELAAHGVDVTSG
jgi:hypothetical protein